MNDSNTSDMPKKTDIMTELKYFTDTVKQISDYFFSNGIINRLALSKTFEKLILFRAKMLDIDGNIDINAITNIGGGFPVFVIVVDSDKMISVERVLLNNKVAKVVILPKILFKEDTPMDAILLCMIMI